MKYWARKNKNTRKIQIAETESRNVLDYTELEMDIYERRSWDSTVGIAASYGLDD
jgi:hypothetical protein